MSYSWRSKGCVFPLARLSGCVLNVKLLGVDREFASSRGRRAASYNTSGLRRIPKARPNDINYIHSMRKGRDRVSEREGAREREREREREK